MKKYILFLQIVIVAAVFLTAYRVSSSPSKARKNGEREDLDKAMNIPRKAPASFSYRTDAATLTTYPNIDCNVPGNSVVQGETSVAINPVDPNIIIAGANDYRSDSIPPRQIVYLSTDGGMTWNDNYLPACPDTFYFVSDPSLTYDANGVAYFGYGAISNDLSSSVMVQRSTDGGLHWQSPASVYASSSSTGLEDKYYVGADASPASPYKNNVYISWTHFSMDSGSAPTYLYLSRSTDEGVTWQAPVTIDSNGYFSEPAVGPNGDVYVAYMNSFAALSNIVGVMIARSTDGGATFGAPMSVAMPVWSLPAALVNKDTIRMISYPSVAVDRSALHPGRIYVAWAALAALSTTPHIYMAYSDNAGETWTPAQVIDGDLQTGTDKFHPWLTCDPKTGTVAVSYYDSRNDPQNILVDVYLSYSNDGAQTFNTVRVTNTSFAISTDVGDSVIVGGSYWADYTGIASYNGKIVPCWTDQRSGHLFYNTDVYISIIESSSGVAEYPAIAPLNITMTNYPNPFSSSTTITLEGIPTRAVDTDASLNIYDAAGNVVADMSPRLTGSSKIVIPFDARALSSGSYYAVLHSKYGNIRKQLTVVR